MQSTKQPLILLVFLLLYSAFSAAHGQAERPRLTPPQPDKIEDWKNRLTEEELSALNKTDNPNNRMKTYVRLSAQRLKKAREYVNQDNYADSSEQIKGYTFLIADAGRISKEFPKGDKAHKTLEIALREQVRLLEGFQYEIGTAHLEVVKLALQTANEVRRQALKLFLGNENLLSAIRPCKPSKSS